MSRSNEPGPFATLFFWIGAIAGGAGGFETGELIGMLVGAAVLGIAGAWIGRLADAVVAWVVFILVAVATLLINAAIRRFVWELLAAVFGGG